MITPNSDRLSLPSLDELSTEEFLLVVGQRVRQQRARKNMSRKRLAEVSSVSERYLAQLESGQGNMSIALLRKVTTAIDMSLGTLMSAEVTESCAQKTSLIHGSQPPAGHANEGAVQSRTGDDNSGHVGTRDDGRHHQDSLKRTVVLRDGQSTELA